MKNILHFSLLFLGPWLYSQNTFPTAAGSNVGIGTISPSTRLQITSASSGTSGLRLTNLTSASATVLGNSRALSVDGSGNVVLTPVLNTAVNVYNSDGTLSADRTVSLNSKNLIFNPLNSNSQIFINGTNGNFGVGTLAPSEKMDVVGALKANQLISTSTQVNGSSFLNALDRNDKCVVLSAGSIIGSGAGYNKTRMLNLYDFPQSNLDTKATIWFGIEDRADYGRYRFIAETGGNTQMIMLNKTQSETFKIFEDGNDNVTMTLPKSNSFFGIGTSNFIDGSDVYRLAVKGAIRADRVKVYTTWADFVFDKTYKLPGLKEVEKYIEENGHLKDIPSANEVENNGIELGEMNKKLLQKIEELTLYVIKINKELEEVKTKLNDTNKL